MLFEPIRRKKASNLSTPQWKIRNFIEEGIQGAGRYFFVSKGKKKVLTVPGKDERRSCGKDLEKNLSGAQNARRGFFRERVRFVLSSLRRI